MKRTLSFILAALILASSLASCGTEGGTETESETKVTETNRIETDSAETDSPETNAPAAEIDSSTVTENGIAKAQIVLSANASQLEQYAAEELAYHITKVSGAEISVVNEGTGDCLPIVIGTPDTVPALRELFPEDIEWLSTLVDENGRRWGDDGFAIRQTADALYIFGATPRGSLNGVYDFIEENMGVLWVRAVEEMGLIYDEMPTITVSKADYREKSPFQFRGTSFGYGFSEAASYRTGVFYARNKLNTENGGGKINKVDGKWEVIDTWVIENDKIGHCLKYWVRTSPIYDPNCTEYWNVDKNGEPIPDDISQINFWSEKTFETVTAAILELLSQHPDLEKIPLAIEDGLLEKSHCYNPPYSEQPYEYAPGQFVDPGNKAFQSTVVFSFVNKVARRVAEEYPNTKIVTYAYHNAEVPPLCEIETNVEILFCPISECNSDSIRGTNNPHNQYIYSLTEQWREYPAKGINVGLYEYYMSYAAIADYERPIWYKLKSDFQYYAECGFNGIVSEGSADVPEAEEGLHVWTGKPFGVMWAMNCLTNWLYSKLLWNPEEDVDALIVYFCDKVYGEASDEMQEYYALLYKGWIEGESETYLWNYKLTSNYYLDTFVYMLDLEDDIKDVLARAYDACDTIAKEQIRYVKETYEANFPEE